LGAGQRLGDHGQYRVARGAAEDHPGRAKIIDLVRAHARGLAATQGSGGLWHQLLDRPELLRGNIRNGDLRLFARAGHQSRLDRCARHGPMVSLGWNAVAREVNAQGQVENTCVGTGMGWDPMFYYFRPVSVFAAHGYGTVLLAERR